LVYHKDNILFIKYKLIQKKILKNYDYFYCIFNNLLSILNIKYHYYIKIYIYIKRSCQMLLNILLILWELYYKISWVIHKQFKW
jgi:hypothetical protein